MERLLVFLFFIMTSTLAYAIDTYTLDPQHTYVLYHISHFGFSDQSGKWYANGVIALDETQLGLSSVKVTIDVAAIDTGNKELDQHLLGPLFFDAKTFPMATFVSDKVQVTGKDSANVYGKLTLHGITKPILLHVHFNKKGTSVITNKMTVGFSATTQIKRSDFGINSFLPGISNEVNISIEAEGHQ